MAKIAELLGTSEYLDTTSAGIAHALQNHGPDFEDAIMIAAAVRCKMTRIVTAVRGLRHSRSGSDAAGCLPQS